MKRAFAYLSFLLLADVAVLGLLLSGTLPIWLKAHTLAILCAVSGGLGGIIYCFRGIYLSACVRKDWTPQWLPWYFIRPIVSPLCGVLSYAFLKAGLIALDATQSPSGSKWGFIVFAFIAGLNVDQFLTKLEMLAKATWGIDPSRSSNSREEAK